MNKIEGIEERLNSSFDEVLNTIKADSATSQSNCKLPKVLCM